MFLRRSSDYNVIMSKRKSRIRIKVLQVNKEVDSFNEVTDRSDITTRLPRE